MTLSPRDTPWLGCSDREGWGTRTHWELVFGSGVQEGGSGAVRSFYLGIPRGGWLGVLLWFGGAHGVWSVKGLWDHSRLDLSSLWVIDWGSI